MNPRARRVVLVCLLALLPLGAGADDDDSGTAAAPAPPGTRMPSVPATPGSVAPAIAHVDATGAASVDTASATPTKDKPRFASEASWITAGYNNDEVVYTIFVRNEDTRILRCSVQIKGSYLEKGRRIAIEDRQLATVFPEQKVQVGNWMGMDPIAGATYSATCRAL